MSILRSFIRSRPEARLINRRKLFKLSAAGAIVSGVAATSARSQDHSYGNRDGEISVCGFGAIGNGKADDTAAFQRAIQFVEQVFERSGDTSYLPIIVIPAGRYVLTDTLHIKPWIKLCTSGSVLLDFTQLPLDRDGIVCRHENNVAATPLAFPGNRSPFLNGSNGTLSILGPGAQRSNGWAIVLGNRDARFSSTVRETGGCYVVVSGWRGALRIDPINVFLSAWQSCRFEGNSEAAVYVAATGDHSKNSGERMTFQDCTFAGAQRAIWIDADSQDFIFDGCSFDYNGHVLCYGPRASYGTIALHHCHVEGLDGLLINALDGGPRLRVDLDHTIVLPRHWKRTDLRPAPRRLVDGPVRFSASSVEFRFESPLGAACETLAGEAVQIEAARALSFPGYPAPVARACFLNADSHLNCDPIGTSVSALSHWRLTERSQLDGVRETNGLVLSATAYGPSAALETKSLFPVTPGETICAAAALSAREKTAKVLLALDFFTNDGTWLSNSNVSARLAEDVAPLVLAAAPAGASQARLRASFSDWTGKLVVQSVFAWRIA